VSFWSKFWLTNLHFSGELFVAVASLLAAYVLVGVWRGKRQKRIALRALGFFLFALFSAMHAAGGGEFAATLQLFVKFLALLFTGISFYIEPVQLPPAKTSSRGSKPRRKAAPLVFAWADLLRGGLRLANLALLAVICWKIYIKFTKGLEKELKNLFRGFVLLFASEMVFSLSTFSGTSYILLSRLAAPFGPVWIVSHLLKFAGFVFIFSWAWGYLRFKLFSQVVGAFVTASLVIFIATTYVYTALLAGVMQANSLENLKINSQTLGYAVERVESQALATASVLAANPSLKKAVKAEKTKTIFSICQEQMISSGVSFLVVVDKDGVILARGGDPEAAWGSLSDNFAVAAALKGEEAVNISTREWVNAPQVLIEAAVPIGSSGAVYTGYILDNAFVDGVKRATGLDVTIFGGEVKAATTLAAADGVSRLVGAKQTDGGIKSKVLEKGEQFLGLSSVSQEEFFSAYSPLKDAEQKILGMLFVGYPSATLFEAAQNSLNTTFLASAILALLSFIPAYLLAKFIEEHQV
jgi:hypothetical protein